MAGMVQKVFSSGWISRWIMNFNDFETDLRQRQQDADPMAAFARQHTYPVEDAVAELSDWAYFNEAPAQPALDPPRAAPMVDHEPDWYLPATPVINPYRQVGRNDPCPCGSGQKFKKCCLGKLDDTG
jgi:uncharacterized protein YecA (UPF0149 family)